MPDVILEFVEGADTGRHVPLDGPMEIGQDADSDLTLNDEQVSRHHARLEPIGSGATVEDLGSTNGTYVNDQALAGRRQLEAGDRVRLGLTVLELRTRQQVRERPSAAAPAPGITQLGHGVLQPVAQVDVETPAAAPGVPTLAVEESEPAFVPRQLLGDPEAESNFAAVARLVDVRVKRQTSIAVFGLLSVSALAVALLFGLR